MIVIKIILLTEKYAIQNYPPTSVDPIEIMKIRM